MFKMNSMRFALLTFALSIVVNLALPDSTFAMHGRGRGRFSDKKAEKFINGHDARDGRFDGRGPRFRFRDRRDRDEFRREQFRREAFRHEQFRRAQFRRAEWRHNEWRHRRALPRRRY